MFERNCFKYLKSGMGEGLDNDNTISPTFPEQKFMTRSNPALSEETTKVKLHSWASDVFLVCVRRAFPCAGFEVPHNRENSSSHSSTSNHSMRSTSDLLACKTGAIIFTAAELRKATSNFSSSCKIGQGGSGIIYRGKLRNGTIVAIKRAQKGKSETHISSEFQSEVNVLAILEHLNLVRLIGYLENQNERIIVEEYVENGNLRQHLDCEFEVVLDIFQRLNIAIDVADALTYLHLYADQPIIHRDIKSSNILLTSTFRAKVADFGFSRIGPWQSEATHVLTNVKGTAGYLDPEYIMTKKLTAKSDVFAFGILLLELITGRRPIEQNRDIDERITVRWAYKKFVDGAAMDILDPRLEKTDVTRHVTEEMLELAFKCSAPTRNDRPTMNEAHEFLGFIRRKYPKCHRMII